MMAAWVLIFVMTGFYGESTTSITVEFNSRESCLEGLRNVHAAYYDTISNHVPRADVNQSFGVCVEK